MKKTKGQARCPTCGKPTNLGEDSPWRPFCSKRCRLIDLGDWLDEAHRIPEQPPVEGERPDGDIEESESSGDSS